MAMFCDYHICENLFKIANKLFFPHHWQKSKKKKKNHDTYSFKITTMAEKFCFLKL